MQLSHLHLQWFLSLSVSGVPGVQRVGPVCHQVHAKGDIWSASVPTEITAVCPGGCGGAEQPCTVSTVPPCTRWRHTVATVIHRNGFTAVSRVLTSSLPTYRHSHTRAVWMDFRFQPTDEPGFPCPCCVPSPSMLVTVTVCTCWRVEVLLKTNVMEVSVGLNSGNVMTIFS